MNILQLENITKNWENEIKILSEIDLTVKSGESVAIIGKSGSGKSTLLQIAGLLDKPTSGRNIITGSDCTDLSDNKLTLLRREKIGFVYQFHHLLSEFNVIENLVIPQLIAGKDDKNAKKNAMEYLKKVGLESKSNLFINKLSGGEKQRVAIIRAIINNPQLVIADEPTGNLDNSNSHIVFNLLQKIAKDTGAAIVIATHCLELAKMCSKIFSLENALLKKL